MKFSLIICTHNPRVDYLRRTLDALRAQTLDRARWELLLIDNCSDPAVACRFDVSWHPNGRIICEEELGLTPARLRGVRESTGPILCYVDDDNVLEPDYLENALDIAERLPHIGCWGGEILGEYEVEPPGWFRGYESLLVIRPLERDQWGNAYRYDDALPCGAGLCVRRPVVDEFLRICAESPLRRSLGRTGASTMSGEDVELAYTAVDMGYGNGRFKALRMLHLIPRGRLEADYLVRLAEGISESNIYLSYLRVKEKARFNPRRTYTARLVFWIQWLKARGPRRRMLLAERAGIRKAVRRLEEMRKSGMEER